MISEALKILDLASLNSKSEWRGYRIGRLSVPMTEEEMKKQVESIEGEDKVSKIKIAELKERVDKFVSTNKPLNFSRKRMNRNDSTPVQSKRQRFGGLTSTPVNPPTTAAPSPPETPVVPGSNSDV